MRNKKTIRLASHDPIGFDRWRDYEQLWSDTYVTYASRPGRKKYHIGPTLFSKTEVEHDLALALERKESDFKAREVGRLECVLSRLETEPFVVVPFGVPHDLPNVYTSSAHINRREAERMVEFLLRSRGVSSDLRFAWERHDKDDLVVIPA